jgi:hypothetical protein
LQIGAAESQSHFAHVPDGIIDQSRAKISNNDGRAQRVAFDDVRRGSSSFRCAPGTQIVTKR